MRYLIWYWQFRFIFNTNFFRDVTQTKEKVNENTYYGFYYSPFFFPERIKINKVDKILPKIDYATSGLNTLIIN